jgi:hypothetical protein
VGVGKKAAIEGRAEDERKSCAKISTARNFKDRQWLFYRLGNH